MKIVDFSTSNSEFTDEIINVPNSNAINIIHDCFYNKTGKEVEIWTAAGKTGTQLTDVTDYTISGSISDSDLPVSISPDVAYTTVAITNATYHNTDLYVSYYPLGQRRTAEVYNNDHPWHYLTAATDDFTFNVERDNRYNNLILPFTRQASGKTITLPDPTLDFWEGVQIQIRVTGTNTGNVTIQGPSSENINLPNGQTETSMVFHGTGTLILTMNGTDYDLVTTGIWDSGSVADSGTDINRTYQKFTDGLMLQQGECDPGTFNVNTAYGALYRSADISIVFGITYTTVYDAQNPTSDTATTSLWTNNMNLSTAGYDFRVISAVSATNRTDDYRYSSSGTWR